MSLTLKKARKLYSRIEFHRRQLQIALNEAHDRGLIEYVDFKEQSPCSTLYATQERIRSTTEKALAAALRHDIENEYWNKRGRR